MYVYGLLRAISMLWINLHTHSEKRWVHPMVGSNKNIFLVKFTRRFGSLVLTRPWVENNPAFFSGTTVTKMMPLIVQRDKSKAHFRNRIFFTEIKVLEKVLYPISLTLKDSS